MNLKKVRGVTIKLPSDKSIAHRWVLLSLIAENNYEIKNLDISDDIKASLEAVKALGVEVVQNDRNLSFKVLRKLPDQHLEIDCHNSGTTARLLIGILSGILKNSTVTLLGDESLSARPMKRVIEPLLELGAKVENKEYLPIKISPADLVSDKTLSLKIASAQVKSAILLSTLCAKGKTTIQGSVLSRDHTEKLLKLCHVDLCMENDQIQLTPAKINNPNEYEVPGDPSAAAFWCLWSYLAQKPVEFSNMLINPTRLGFFDAIKEMGMKVHFNILSQKTDYEPIAQVLIEPNLELEGIHINADEVPRLVDEIILLAVFMSRASSHSTIKGVEELKYKESNRLRAFEIIAKGFGAKVAIKNGDIEVIPGYYPANYSFDELLASKDHRVIMCLAVISKALEISMRLEAREHVSVSYPSFWKTLENF